LFALLGYVIQEEIEGWLQFHLPTQPGGFFGVTEDRGHVPNQNRIAFRSSTNSDVDRAANALRLAGALNMEGPGFEGEAYYAIFFEDPFGNRFEICCRS
jgi:catechol 2,3-dioxygenase-like lactoylglutathione lyase family enzyme